MCRNRHSTHMLENTGPFLLYAFLYIKLISKINIGMCVCILILRKTKIVCDYTFYPFPKTASEYTPTSDFVIS